MIIFIIFDIAYLCLAYTVTKKLVVFK